MGDSYNSGGMETMKGFRSSAMFMVNPENVIAGQRET